MSALDKLIRKPTAKLTHIEYAIKQSYAYGSAAIAEPAADDLANIDAELAALRARVEKLEAERNAIAKHIRVTLDDGTAPDNLVDHVQLLMLQEYYPMMKRLNVYVSRGAK